MVFADILRAVSQSRTPVCIDSRSATKGCLFVAVKGCDFDGHDFINEAVEKGAATIVCQKMPSDKSKNKCQIVTVDDSAKAAAILAQASYGNPCKKLINLAVTGTNGKTTTAFITKHIIDCAKRKCGLIGTIVYDAVSEIVSAPLTTPNCVTIAQKASDMVAAGAEFMVIEASSHAIEQSRIAAIDFTAAAFTNLTGDHLDYHGTMQNYFDSKAKLFASLGENNTAVLNSQSPESKKIAQQTKANIMWYGVDCESDISAYIKSSSINGTSFTFGYKDYVDTITTSLIGKYNIENCLAAAGLAIAAGIDVETVCEGLATFENVPGRLQRVACDKGFSVFVDYAHTDDALANVLSVLKPLCKGKLAVVFGAGGDRDKTKRPRMAKAAEKSADKIIVTSDNPRTEKPTDIINDIKKGFENKNDVVFEPDRKKAIAIAIENAATDDVILIAGKGHEDYQIVGTKKIYFSDNDIATEIIKRL